MSINSAGKLSIIIPTYNRGATLVSAVTNYVNALREPCESLGFSIEIIVVDDASTDATASILATLATTEKDLQVESLPDNSGPGPARNAGLKKATGDWVWFLDDDDCLDDNVLLLLQALLKLDDTCDVLAHSLNHLYSNDLVKNRLEIGQRVLMFHDKQEVFNYVVRRSLLESHEIQFSSGYHEDIRFVFDLIRHAKGVEVLAEKVVLKQLTRGAITSTMTEARSLGYVKAFNDIVGLKNISNQGSEFYEAQRLFEQTLGVILYLINKEVDAVALKLLDHLKSISCRDDVWSNYVLRIPMIDPVSSNFRYAGSVWRQKKDGEPESLLSSLRYVFQTRLSCKDLDSSLFLGPDEIRACCKRFFVGTERKGDVVLLEASEDIGMQEIQAAKDDLISRINTDDASECSGCPYIERRPAATSGISYISLENFSYCNMRCTYCSPKYYGGTEASYNAAEIIEKLAASSGALDASCHVVWGGGEPTLSQRFDSINRSLASVPQVYKIRVLTNSLRHSTSLETALADSKFHVVTSIDAGTQALFDEIRGRGKLADVLGNLQAYYKALKDKRRLTVKYILVSNNYHSGELQAFVADVKAAGLMGAMFQISCDFTDSEASEEKVSAMYELAVRLYMAGAKTVFFDDLIRDRLVVTRVVAKAVRKHLEALKLDQQFILSPESYEQVVLWGLGIQSEWYLAKTNSGSSGRILGVVGNLDQFRDLEHAAENSQIRIFPSGVQSMYEIVKTIEDSGLGKRIFQGVIL